MQQEVAKMRMDPRPQEVRAMVVQIFGEFAVTVRTHRDLDETILIQEGRYFARTYKAGGYMAMWLVGVGVVQFYDAEGNMLRTLNLLRELKPQRMAA
jgi:hypothetical protein